VTPGAPREGARPGEAADASYVEVPGVRGPDGAAHRARVRTSGPAGGAGDPVLLLVHGIGRSLEDFVALHDRLAERHTVVSADLPGFGLTRALPGRPSLAGFARALVVDLVDALGHGDRPVVVVGNSLGGAVAMTAAVEHPDRVAGVALLGAAGFGREARVSVLPMVWGVASALPVVGGHFTDRARRAGVEVNERIFHDPSFATPEMVRHAARVGRQPDWLRTFVLTALGLGAPVVGTWPRWRRELLARLRDQGTPALVVWGDDDQVLPAHHYEAAVAALPHATGHLLEDVGHAPQIEAVDEVARLVEALVAEVRAGLAGDRSG